MKKDRKKKDPRIKPGKWYSSLENKRSPDPSFGAIMHVIYRLSTGQAPEGELEKKFSSIYEELSIGIRNNLIRMATDYAGLPKFIKAKTSPPIMADLDISIPITHELLKAAYKESIKFGAPGPEISDVHLSADNTLLIFGKSFKAHDQIPTITLKASDDLVCHINAIKMTPGIISIKIPSAIKSNEFELRISHSIYQVNTQFLKTFIDPPPTFPPPVIIGLEPEGCRPGETIYINGENFSPYADFNGCIVHIEPDGRDIGLSMHVAVNSTEDSNGWKADIISSTQIRLYLGYDIEPGKYTIQVFDTRTHLNSDIKPFKIYPWKFRIDLINFFCIDESDEASDSDEIVAVWGVAADNHYFLKSTREYEDVDGGGTYWFRPEDREVLTPNGEFFEVTHTVSFVIHLLEADSNQHTQYRAADNSAQLAGVLSSAPSPAAKLAGAGLFLAGFIAGLNQDSGDDWLGEQTIGWTAPELLIRTLNAERKFDGELFFLNSDGDGSHVVRYTVYREFDKFS